MPKNVPSYRQRKGSDHAIVTLTDAVTKQRRDYWLGPHGSPESRERYHRLIAEWEAAGRRLPAPIDDPHGPCAQTTVGEIVHAYWTWASQHQCAIDGNLTTVLQLLRRFFGSSPAAEFGPKKLRIVREAMACGDPNSIPPRKPWTRQSVNKQTQRIASVFKWAASQELIPVTVFQALKTIEPLRRGQTTAPEATPVRPVAVEKVEAIRPFLSPTLQAIIDLQLLTGARGGELFRLRKGDIDRTGPVWTYTPQEHKTAYRGRTRTIYFGPRARRILEPFLLRPDDAFLFSPEEAVRHVRRKRHELRKTPLWLGNKPGSCVVDDPQRTPGDHYTKNAYRRAIARACRMAFPPPEHLARQKIQGKKHLRWETDAELKKRLGPQRWSELLRWRKEHHWHPHQLRHTAATLIRREFGLEAAQIALGHSSALITDAVYAERDTEKVVEVMQKIG